MLCFAKRRSQQAHTQVRNLLFVRGAVGPATALDPAPENDNLDREGKLVDGHA
jgi:hypothetical protein